MSLKFYWSLIAYTYETVIKVSWLVPSHFSEDLDSRAVYMLWASCGNRFEIEAKFKKSLFSSIVAKDNVLVPKVTF